MSLAAQSAEQADSGIRGCNKMDEEREEDEIIENDDGTWEVKRVNRMKGWGTSDAYQGGMGSFWD